MVGRASAQALPRTINYRDRHDPLGPAPAQDDLTETFAQVDAVRAAGRGNGGMDCRHGHKPLEDVGRDPGAGQRRRRRDGGEERFCTWTIIGKCRPQGKSHRRSRSRLSHRHPALPRDLDATRDRLLQSTLRRRQPQWPKQKTAGCVVGGPRFFPRRLPLLRDAEHLPIRVVPALECSRTRTTYKFILHHERDENIGIYGKLMRRVCAQCDRAAAIHESSRGAAVW